MRKHLSKQIRDSKKRRLLGLVAKPRDFLRKLKDDVLLVFELLGQCALLHAVGILRGAQQVK